MTHKGPIEERLAKAANAYTETIATCEVDEQVGVAFDLARKLAALLREASKYARHTCPGPMTRPCTCGFSDYDARAALFLEGGGDE